MKVEKLSDCELDSGEQEEYYEVWYICPFAHCQRAYNKPSRYFEHKREAHKDNEQLNNLQPYVSSPQIRKSSYGRKITCVNQNRESAYFPNGNWGKRSPPHRKLLNPSKKLTNNKCPFCKKLFENKSTLKLHVAAHKRPFKCQAIGCQYTAKKKYCLENHEKTHTGSVNIRICSSSCQKFFRRDTNSKLYIKLANTCNSCYRSSKLQTK